MEGKTSSTITLFTKLREAKKNGTPDIHECPLCDLGMVKKHHRALSFYMDSHQATSYCINNRTG